MEHYHQIVYQNLPNEIIRAIFIAMASFDGDNEQELFQKYDFSQIKRYGIIGYELIGSYVIGAPRGMHFLCSCRNYEVYEVLSRTDSAKDLRHGHSLVLFKDVLIGDWLLASLQYRCSVKKYWSGPYLITDICEHGTYDLKAEARITKTGKTINAFWKKRLVEMWFSIPERFKNIKFDSLNVRKSNVFNMDPREFMSRFGIEVL